MIDPIFRRSVLLGFAIVLQMFGVANSQPSQALPNDAGMYHMLVVTNATAQPADAALLSAISGHPGLSEIASACKRFHFPSNDPLYLSRYAASLQPTALPCVALVRSDGGVLYKACGANIPAPDLLYEKLFAIARADRVANPRPIMGPQRIPPGVPNQFGEMIDNAPAIQWPTGGRFPGGIPDTHYGLTIAPSIDVSPLVQVAVIICTALLIFVLFVVVAVAGGAALFFRD